MKTRAYRGSGILMAGLLLMSSACAYSFGRAGDTRRAQDAEGTVHLNVTNQSGGPVEIFATGTGTSYRIGTVYQGLAGHFLVRPGMTVNGPVEFTARYLGGAVVRSGPILLAPGAVVDFEIGQSPVASNATVRP